MRSLTPQARHERRVQVIRLRKSGFTYDEIAEQTGLSRKGVFNICGTRRLPPFLAAPDAVCRQRVNQRRRQRKTLFNWAVNAQQISARIQRQIQAHRALCSAPVLPCSGCRREGKRAFEKPILWTIGRCWWFVAPFVNSWCEPCNAGARRFSTRSGADRAPACSTDNTTPEAPS